MAGQEKEEFQMTPDEMERISKALKEKDFRELLVEYANEISDPVNKKKYEEEIIAMEKQRGQQVRLLKPQAGFVIKTCRFSDNMKVFINICTSPDVENYTQKDATQHGANGAHISLPHTLTPTREDVDKAGKPCVVFDVCFHPNAYQTALDNDRFRSLLIETALDTLEKNTKLKVDRKNKRFPKMTYKGVPQPAIIRQIPNEQNLDQKNNNDLQTGTKASECFEQTAQDKTSSNNTRASNVSAATTPKYKIIHRGYFDMQNFTNTSRDGASSYPKELIIEIELPLAKSTSGIDLDIFEKQLKLVSVDPAYHLDISLPCKVNDDNGKAQFDKSTKLLTVTLPVRPPEVSQTIEKKLIEELKNNSLTNYQEMLTDELPTESTTVSDDSLNKQHTGANECEPIPEGEIYDNKSKDGNLNDTSRHVNGGISRHVNGDDVNHFQEEISIADMENLKFDTTILESLPGHAKLPPYCYDQTIHQITVLVKVSNVQIAHLSLGFTSQQVCLSFPQNPNDSTSSDWSLVIRLADGNFLEKDDCGFNLHTDCFELNLRKRHDSLGLWEKFFVGVSEIALHVELFMTENVASEMLKVIRKTAEPAALTRKDLDELKALRLEGRLEQLLAEQDKQADSNISHFNAEHQCEDALLSEDERKMESATDTSDKTSEMSEMSDGDDLSLQVNLLDLQDDVVVDSSPLTSPSSSHGDTSRFTTQRVYERSLSHDIIKNPRLRSILKRSKSDGGSYDTDGECSYSRSRAATFSDQNSNTQAGECGTRRRRHKSVTFSEEPLVFEFAKLSKRQWKKQHKDDKQRENLEKKVSDMFKSVKQEVPKIEDTSSKMGKKKKKEKRRQRHNSESRSEEEGDVTAAGKKSRKKKKKNKQRNFHDPENNSSGCDSSCETQPSLNNSLIFELE